MICPICEKPTLEKEGTPFNGLECKSCHTCFTHSFAVRNGFVDEVCKGDRSIAIKSFKAKKTFDRLTKKAKKSTDVIEL